MNENEKGFWYWFVAGSGAATGVWLVSLLASFLIFAAGNISEQYELAQIKHTVQATSNNLQRDAKKLVFPHSQVVTVPGDSVQNCLKKSGGVADEQYEKCRTGYHYTWTGTGPAPTE